MNTSMNGLASPDTAVAQRSPEKVRKLKRPGRWASYLVMGVLAVLAIQSVATNPNFGWPIVAQYFTSPRVLDGSGKHSPINRHRDGPGCGAGSHPGRDAAEYQPGALFRGRPLHLVLPWNARVRSIALLGLHLSPLPHVDSGCPRS